MIGGRSCSPEESEALQQCTDQNSAADGLDEFRRVQIHIVDQPAPLKDVTNDAQEQSFGRFMDIHEEEFRQARERFQLLLRSPGRTPPLQDYKKMLKLLEEHHIKRLLLDRQQQAHFRP